MLPYSFAFMGATRLAATKRVSFAINRPDTISHFQRRLIIITFGARISFIRARSPIRTPRACAGTQVVAGLPFSFSFLFTERKNRRNSLIKSAAVTRSQRYSLGSRVRVNLKNPLGNYSRSENEGFLGDRFTGECAILRGL